MVKSTISILLGLAIIFMVWLALYVFVSDDELLPSPIAVYESLMKDWGVHAKNTSITAIEAATGLLLASVMSYIVVIIVGFFPATENIFYPFITMLKASPAIAFVPLFMVLVGSGMCCKMLVSALIAFFPLIVGGIDGLRHVPQRFLLMAKGYGTSRYSEFINIKSKYVTTGFLTGLKTSAPLSVVGAIVGEYVAGGHPSGLGHFIMAQSVSFHMDEVLAGAACATFLGIAFFSIVLCFSSYFSRRSHVDK